MIVYPNIIHLSPFYERLLNIWLKSWKICFKESSKNSKNIFHIVFRDWIIDNVYVFLSILYYMNKYKILIRKINFDILDAKNLLDNDVATPNESIIRG